MKEEKETQQNQQQVQVRYNETSAQFASQFLINTTAEDLTINFSSGALVDPNSGGAILPIHSRIAMTTPAAKRLLKALNSALQQQTKSKVPDSSKAKLPSVQ
ncbi:MAG: hypothetical protein CSB23_05345 [Deltaproteobacteria bacterium]|nr:MAG: hypothetical protein CSB23_05345 [Deltaproteobacteria bacterium]